ncbi:hypothetical protein ACA910_013622 [Epithemia clementina (nom. ined.)]
MDNLSASVVEYQEHSIQESDDAKDVIYSTMTNAPVPKVVVSLLDDEDDILDDDQVGSQGGGEEEDDDDDHDGKSEAGDDIHCTQLLMIHEDEKGGDDIVCSYDDDDEEEEDEEAGLALTELLSRSQQAKRLSLDIRPVLASQDDVDTKASESKNDKPRSRMASPSKSQDDKTIPNGAVIIDLLDDENEDENENDTKPNVAKSVSPAALSGSQSIPGALPDEAIVLRGTLAGTTTTLGETARQHCVGSNQNNENLSLCPTCGACLAHIKTWKGRVNHVKRCSKQHGVSANEIRIRLEEEEDAAVLHDDANENGDGNWFSRSFSVGKAASYQHQSSSSSQHDQQLPPTTCTPSQKGPPTGGLPPHSQKADKASNAVCANRPPSIMDMLMEGARRIAQVARKKRKLSLEPNDERKHSVAQQNAAGGGGRKRFHRQNNFASNAGNNQEYSSSYSSYKPRAGCPAYKKITGTDFVVDGFYYAKPSLTQNYFLTHFHSDHYGGINRHWNAGTIFCSKPTANLVNSQLGVDWQYLHILPMNKPVAIPTGRGISVTVTLIDANHCPGAVMMLFQVGGRSILHVGDFRWSAGVMLSPPESPLRTFCAATGGTQRLDELFLDTTYCNPKYELPCQQEAISAAVEYAEKQVKEARLMKQSILLLFGAYTIGKERIYLAVAEHLKMKVYVDRRRYRILSQFGWPPERMTIFTTNPQESVLWVVPLGHVSMNKLPSYTSVQIGKSFSRDFDRVIGFRPTGWTLTSKPQKYKDGSKTSLIKAATRGKVSSCGVPYSEHSSFPELVECLKALDPRKIVPTVSVSKSKEQVDILLLHVAK